jgi:hypothetical protein
MKMPRWLRLLVWGAALLFVASFVLSQALRLRAARRYLTAHLAASFGRPVEASSFDFSLLDGGRIEAHQVTVSEDPHFGNEYFLRADTVAAGLRWSSLLGGRFEFDSVSLSRPSLNLVRDAEGQWNVERWLPPVPGSRPGFVGPVQPPSEVRATRPVRIDVSDGRINFKRGESKVAFALTNVSGSVDQNGPGRWQLDLEARPMRAGVQLQDIGTVRVRGSIGGTTARLQPAELTLTWRDASLADTLRLMNENDYGMRGELAVDLDARVGAPQQESAASGGGVTPAGAGGSGGARWSFSGVARLSGIHGWRLAERATDPAANLTVDADWSVGEPRLQIHKMRVEMPASKLDAQGDVDWARGINPDLRVTASTFAFSDALSWYKALRPDVAGDLQATGTLGIELKVAGWPLRLQDGAVASSGLTLAGKSLPAALQIGAVRASLSRGKLDLSPTQISFAPPAAPAPGDNVQAASETRTGFAVRGSVAAKANGTRRWPPDWSVSIDGATARVQDWLALNNALAQPLNAGWTASGGLAMKMRGEHRTDSPAPPWTGSMDFVALTLNPSYVNQPVTLPKAHVDMTAVQRTVTLSAEAFGTNWRGSIARKYSDAQWTFDLTADKLDATELDRWLGPRARPGFLARIIGSDSGAATGPVADALVTRLAARGRLRAASISVPPMRIDKFDGQVELSGRTIHTRGAQGDFFGGKISGSLDAQLVRDPIYEFQGRFDRVDLSLLGRAVPSLDGRIAGTASATMSLSAHGIGRQELVDSLEGQGILNGRNVSLRGIDLSNAISGNEASAAPGLFASLQGSYRVRNRSVDLADFVMDNPRGRLVAEGRVDFSHALNIRIRSSAVEPATAPAGDPPPRNFLLGGTIEAPSVVLASAVPKPPARGNPK